MEQDLARIKRAAHDLSQNGLRRMLRRYIEINRSHLPGTILVDAIVFALVWLAWGQHGHAMGLPLMATAVGLFLFGSFVAGSDLSALDASGAPFGGGSSGRHPREFMDSNEEWVRAKRSHRQNVRPTANALYLASLLPLFVGLVLWGFGI